MTNQVNTLIVMMRKQWVSTDDAFRAGITSFHRRLADFREKYIDFDIIEGYVSPIFLINGKDYILKDRERQIFTRWGKAKIKEYRLVAVK